ncbi:MAG: U32 family peptidase [Acholeplasma sp.]|nr:U32 family peptidase [Acholeplasma sp.]
MTELLAPAGDLEKLKIAILYGADAVFIGGQEFSLRARASNFTLEDIKEGARFCHEHGKKLYVTTNIIPHNENMKDLIEYLKGLEEASVDAIIAASPYIVQTALEHTKIPVHISTQQSVVNSNAVAFWKDMGAERVVLGRELDIHEIKAITEKSEVEIEVFIHGGMCASYSGRCTLSNNMTDRDANRGGCAHSCRWNYDLYANDKLISDEKMPFSMSSKDLQTLRFIPDLMDANVSSLKIEGRMKSIHYIATVVRTYRLLMDEYIATKTVKDMNFYEEEIRKAENRLTSHGFLAGMPKAEQQLYNLRNEEPTKEFLGIVIDYDPITQYATIEQRNHFIPSETVEFVGPRYQRKMTIANIYDESMNKLDAARHPKQILKVKVPFEVHAFDMLRKVL